MIKRGFLFISIISLIITLFGCSKPKQGKNISIAMVTDIAGLEDNASNDAVYEGLKRAEEEFGVKIDILESQKIEDYVDNIISKSKENHDLIIATGLPLSEGIVKGAEKYSKQRYAIIGEYIDRPNVASINFKEEEGSFLVGVIAGLTTKSNTIGFIGGVKNALSEKYEYGFQAGVRTVNPEAMVLVNYIGSYEQASLGKTVAIEQNLGGADVIYHGAGGSGIGVIEAAGEKDFWVIGSIVDQSHLDPEHVLCSMVKREDMASYAVAKSIVEKSFAGGSLDLGVKEEGVDLSDKAKNTTPEITERVNKYREAIVKNEFMVPYDSLTYEAFVTPIIE